MRNVLSGTNFTEEGVEAASSLPTILSLGIWPETERKKKKKKKKRKLRELNLNIASGDSK